MENPGQSPHTVQVDSNMADINKGDQTKSQAATGKSPQSTTKSNRETVEVVDSPEKPSGGQSTKNGDTEVGKNVKTDFEKLEEKLLTAIGKISCKIDSTAEDIKKETKKDLDGLKGEMEELKKTLASNTKKLNDIEVSVNFVHKEVDDLKKKVSEVQSDNKRLKERLDAAERGRKDLQKELNVQQEAIAERFNDMERHSRGFNIRVKGVTGLPPHPNYRHVVGKILVEEDLNGNLSLEDIIAGIEHAHPVGKREGEKVTLIARLFSRPRRNAILARAKKKTYEAGKIRVVEDMTRVDFIRRKNAYPLMKDAYDEGKKAVFRRGKLIIEGQETAIPE